MSHITRVKTQLNDLLIIKTALADLGIDFVEGNDLHVPQIPGTVDMVIQLPNSRYPIAVLKSADGTYNLSGEESVMRLAQAEELVQKLNQRYAYHMVKDRLLQQGFHLETETLGDERSIHLTLRRTN